MTDAFDRLRALDVEGLAAASGGAAAAATTAEAAGGLKADMNDQMVIVVGALCKMFVGDLVHGGACVRIYCVFRTLRFGHLSNYRSLHRLTPRPTKTPSPSCPQRGK